MQADNTIENLLELHGIRFVIDDSLGLWVKFEVQQVEKSISRPHGIKYSLTLHNRLNDRIIGFDNSHTIECGNKKRDEYDHWHHDSANQVRVYHYKSAAKLLEDFWHAVDQMIKYLSETKQ